MVPFPTLGPSVHPAADSPAKTCRDLLVEPDVLGKDLAACIEAQQRDDWQRVQRIVDRAARRGNKGWHVGQREHFTPVGFAWRSWSRRGRQPRVAPLSAAVAASPPPPAAVAEGHVRQTPGNAPI